MGFGRHDSETATSYGYAGSGSSLQPEPAVLNAEPGVALPKPLPGIPYNKDALKTILGDGAEIQKIRRAGGSARNWFGQQTARHMSPLVQAFLAPFTKPVLILSDFREAQDILLCRNKEFDRASRASDALRGVIPWHHIGMRTADPQFRRNRELVKDLMTPHFLNTVNAPAIYDNAQIFLGLWRVKAQLAGGRPFQAGEDIHVMTFDIIKVVALGEDDSRSMTAQYLDTVRSATSADQMSETTKDIVFVFAKNEANDDLRAHQTQQEAVGESITHPSPKLFHIFHNLTAPMREAFALKTSMLERQVSLAVKQFKAGEGVKSALDYMIQREASAAKKAGRQPLFDTPSMRDELYGYIGAGHDTTSTAFQWGLKHLTVHQCAQKKLRDSLRAAYAKAFDAGRQPSVADITKTSVPYLDAVIEEVLRLSAPVRQLVREAMVDTTLLGHRVPKGTTTDSWDHADPQAFVPERWLKKTVVDDGAAEAEAHHYDAQAGPFLSFGTGIRGCFGRRLAYLELRILMTLLLWNFEARSPAPGAEHVGAGRPLDH
ncbi:hypothetical protein DL764_008606 [Monosporascus ibericus]|uniref:Cytochrome P450 n=1 Tax=Monosporascus ibericus TaxID=155417 RepID=A0A4Q4SX39_9PEZI|nr:hypothetical protein DL764_008606 [Monosporascus ibericus]